MWPPLVVPVAEELRGPQSLLRAHGPPGAMRGQPLSRTAGAGLSAAPIVRDFGLCLLPSALRASGTGRGPLSTGEGKQRGASHMIFSGPAGLPGGSHSVPALPGPLAARMPLATLPSHASSLSVGQSTVGAGHRIPPPPPNPVCRHRVGSVECACAEPAALRSLPCQILLWRAAPSRAGGSRQPRLGSCPELPAPPRSELPGLGAAAEPGARRRQGRAGSPPELRQILFWASWLG